MHHYPALPFDMLASFFVLFTLTSCLLAGGTEIIQKPAEIAVLPAKFDQTTDPLAALDVSEVQELLQWLSLHPSNPTALSQEALNRAALRSLLTTDSTGAIILAKPNNSNSPTANPPLYARLGFSAAYARTGDLTPENINALRTFLTGLPTEVTTLLLDLRTLSPVSVPLASAAALTSLFLPEKTPLYLRIAPPAAPVLYLSLQPPVWNRRLWLLFDNQTPPAAELAAHLLQRHLRVLTFGTPSCGILNETVDFPLGPHHLVRLPSATVSSPDGTRLSGTVLTPQVLVKPRPASRHALLSLTDPKALPTHLTESDRPRPNEASLMAGIPAEWLTFASSSSNLAQSPRPDPVLQQAIDLLQSAAFLKLDAPEEIKRAELGH